MVFDTLTPYLKGFHLALASHIPQRDHDGWKFSHSDYLAHLENKISKGEYSCEQTDELLNASQESVQSPPPQVKVNDYFWNCVNALGHLMQEELPPGVTV